MKKGNIIQTKTLFSLTMTVLVLITVIGCTATNTGGASGTSQPTALGEAQPTAAASDKPQELTIWIQDWGADNNKTFDDSIAKYFSPSHPNIKLTISHIAVKEKLLPSVASGKVPDLTYLSSSFTIPYAINGALEPLDDFMKKNNIDPKNDFSADINASYSWNGKLYGIGLAANSEAIFYSKAAFKDAGLDPEKPPTTLEEISQYDSKLIKKDANGNLQRIGLYFTRKADPVYYALLLAKNSKLYDSAANKAVVNDEASVQAYQWMLDEIKPIGIDKYDKFMGGFADGNNDPLFTGSAAMVVDGYWRVLSAKQFAPNLDYGVIPLPKSYAGESWGFGIPKGAKNKAGAEEFLTWLLKDKVAGKFMAEGTNPFNYKPGLDEWFKAFQEISKGTPNEKYIPVWNNILNNSMLNNYISPAPVAYDQWLAQAMDDVIHNKKTPKQALDEANAQIQKEIDKALAAAQK